MIRPRRLAAADCLHDLDERIFPIYRLPLFQVVDSCFIDDAWRLGSTTKRNEDIVKRQGTRIRFQNKDMDFLFNWLVVLGLPSSACRLESCSRSCMA